VEVLAELFLKRGLPCHIRSDNGPEFTAKVVRRWLEKFEIKLAGQGWTPAKICL